MFFSAFFPYNHIPRHAFTMHHTYTPLSIQRGALARNLIWYFMKKIFPVSVLIYRYLP